MGRDTDQVSYCPRSVTLAKPSVTLLPQKDKEAHELEKQRYISLLTAVVFHRTQPMSDAMRVELTKECAPRPKVTPK